MYIDVHCHIDLLEKEGKLLETIDKCKGKVRILTNGGRRKSNRDSLELKEEHPEIEIALGLYPLDAKKMTDRTIDSEIEFIRKNRNKIIAVGEVGMDFKEEDNAEKRKKQEEVFGKFVKLAMELGKPVEVHSRKAELECIEILEKLKAKKVIMHCFSGNFKLVKRIIENGWMLSIPTSVTRSEHFQKVIELCPINQLLCETDSPYLHPDREWPNTPNLVIESYRKIAEIKKIELKDVESALENNFNKLIGK